MAFLPQIRNYFAERMSRIKSEWQRFQKHHNDTIETLSASNDTDIRRQFHQSRDRPQEHELAAQLQSELDQIYDSFNLRNLSKHEPFEYFGPLTSPLPENRTPAPGIRPVPHVYHQGRTVSITEDLPETGFRLDPLLTEILTYEFPRYIKYTHQYCRPLGTTNATFADFNKPQFATAPLNPERKEQVLAHIIKRLDARPFLPLHFVDTQFAKLPLNTGTGYHNRHSFKINAHAKYSRPDDYSKQPTSKGYYLNAFLEDARFLVHRIKDSGLPFDFNFTDNDELDFLNLTKALNAFFDKYPTLLFTRNHISDRDGKLKQRPVYAVDDLFLLIETMLTFPLLVQARRPSCAIMYGLETIRGSNAQLDKLAQRFRSFFSIDWSEYDQRLPRSITDCYYEDFLPRLIIISDGYQPTFEYPTYPDLTEEKMYTRMSNLLRFLHMWYNNMTFLSPDGFAYRRTHAGVPSGLLNTQYLDSFGNLYLIIDGLIEYGCSEQEIDDILLFIMGDDNTGFTHWTLIKLEKFISWFESFAYTRYGMKLSKAKSTLSNDRGDIETLSYQCCYGMPRRPIGKLVAQLCFPEHGPDRRYMSYRAIGMAYASCAQDTQFHQFCRSVYTTFLPYAAPLDESTIFKITKFLPGQFKLLDSYVETIPLDRFPTIRQVINMIHKWHGPLSFAPKWNYAHFINDPDYAPPFYITMYDYEYLNNIKSIPTPTLPV